MVRQPDATMQPTPQYDQLMSKHRVLGFKPQLRLEWRGQDGKNETEQPDHSVNLRDSITASTRMRFSVHTTTIFGRDGVSHAQIVRRSHAVDKHPGLVASSDGIDNRARIGRVGFLGELVEARLIVEPAIDPLEGFGLRQPLQRLIDGVPRGEIDEITGQTLRGASARIEHGCFQVGRGAYSCPKIVALFGQLPKSSVRNTYTNFGQCVCQARNRLVGESRILHLKPKRNSRVICAPSRALPRRARPRGSGKTLG
jgi:hypothetical protein